MTRKRLAALCGATIMATGLAAAIAATAAMAQETLRFSSFEPPVAHITKNIFTPWAKQVSEASEGTINIEMFPGGTLGRNPAQQLKLVEDGVADIAWVIPGYTPGRFEEGTVSELPFIVPSATAGSLAMWEMVETGVFKGDYEKFKLIGVLSSAPNGLATTAPIAEPEDMDGKNIRAPGPTLLAAVEAVGGVPVGGITAPTIAESLSRGLIDGTFSQWGAVKTFRMDEVITDFTELTLGATPMLVIMNKEKYDSLPDAAKAAIDKYSGEAMARVFGPSFDQNVAESREDILGRKDINVIEPDAETVEKWRAAVQPATDKWIANTENGQAIYDAFAAAVEKHSKGGQ